MERIESGDVLYVEGWAITGGLSTKTRRIHDAYEFKETGRDVAGTGFCRVHKSFFVSVDKIESIERNRIKILDKYIPVSETFRKNFFDLIEKNKLY